MSRSPLSLALSSAFAASIVTFLLFFLAFRGVRAAEPDGELAADLAALAGRVDALDERLGRPEEAPPVDVGLGAAVEALAERVGRIEGLERRQVAAAAAEPVNAEREPSAEAPREEREKGALAKEEFAALLARVIADSDGTAVSPDDQARFWETARTTGLVDELIADLQAGIERDAEDAGLRLELADAYVAKLLTVPAGPERGVWGMRAEEQWRAALSLDPRSWEAEFRLGETLSYYPEFLNKTGEAIEGLERARELQGALVPEPRHAQTYLLLARLYSRDGDPARAQDVLRDGLARHPGDDALREALAALERK